MTSDYITRIDSTGTFTITSDGTIPYGTEEFKIRGTLRNNYEQEESLAPDEISFKVVFFTFFGTIADQTYRIREDGTTKTISYDEAIDPTGTFTF